MSSEHIEDYGSWQAYVRREQNAERIVRSLIAAAGGPFVQRRPTRREYRGDSLRYFAEKGMGWPGFRHEIVKRRLEQLGITIEQIAQYAR